MKKLALAGLALVCSVAPVEAKRSAVIAHPDCGVTMPCEGVTASDRGLDLRKKLPIGEPQKHYRRKAKKRYQTRARRPALVVRRFVPPLPVARPKPPEVVFVAPLEEVPERSLADFVASALAHFTRPIQDVLRAINDSVPPPSEILAPPVVDDRERRIAQARAYLIRTAVMGGTMARQGAELAIGRLHPEFALRLAGAILDARANGLPRAGIFSAYRPPAFGIGGFSDKFNSMHAYGFAVDMTGIGKAGSPESLLWYRIAGRHKLFNPYGPYHRREHNHYQPTFTKMISRSSPLRRTITAWGPIDLPKMWQAFAHLVRDQVVTSAPAPPRRYARRQSRAIRLASAN